MRTRIFVPLAAALLAAPLQATAAPSTGDWTAWYGCWRAVSSGVEAAPLVCVLPGDAITTVRIVTIEADAISEETVVRADGVARPIEEGGCTGSERAFFSNDGRRVFTRAELACSGLGRISTGVLGMVSEAEWVDAQALTVNGQHAARSIRYRAASASEVPAWVVAELPRNQQLAQETARLNAAVPLDIAAVIEASRNVAAPAVEALLAERQHGFGLNAARLTELEEQRVPASTIDVMVALSYPSRFAVAPREDRTAPAAEDLSRTNAAWVEDCYDPYWTTRRYSSDCRGRSGYGYRSSRGGLYGYSPYGYDPYGWNYGSRPVIVIVRPGGDDSQPTGGAAVKGRGYTRNGSSTGTATRRGAERNSEPSARGTPRPSSSTTSTGSSSSDKPATTRTAKPRGGN